MFITGRGLTFNVHPLYLLSCCFRELIWGTGNLWV